MKENKSPAAYVNCPHKGCWLPSIVCMKIQEHKPYKKCKDCKERREVKID